MSEALTAPTPSTCPSQHLARFRLRSEYCVRAHMCIFQLTQSLSIAAQRAKPKLTSTNKHRLPFSNLGSTLARQVASSNTLGQRRWSKTMNESVRPLAITKSTFSACHSESTSLFLLNPFRRCSLVAHIELSNMLSHFRNALVILLLTQSLLTARYVQPQSLLRGQLINVQTLSERATNQIEAVNRAVLRADAYCHSDPSCPFRKHGRGSVPRVTISS